MPKPGRPNRPADETWSEVLKQQPLHRALAQNMEALRDIFRDCSDLVCHDLASAKGRKGSIVYMDGLVQKSLVDRDIALPLLKAETISDMKQLATRLTPMSDARVVETLGDVVQGALSGDAILLVDGVPGAVSYGVRGWESRAITEPETEALNRGPREGFVETLRFNTALLRRKIKSPALKLEQIKLGRITQTDVLIAYLADLADPSLVQEVRTRLQRIEIDGVLEGGYVEQFIEDCPLSPFPQVQNTERPDTAAANLLEGRVVILVDGTPLCQRSSCSSCRPGEDYYERPLITSAIRALRYLFLQVALLLPAVYVAITAYHPGMIPTDLLLSVAAAREVVPFPGIVEALAMEVTFEILREAGIRLPLTPLSALSVRWCWATPPSARALSRSR